MEWLLNICIVLQYIIYSILHSILSYVYREKPPSIPPIKNPLLQLRASVLAKKIRQKEISSQQVVQAYIDRVKEVNPYVNAVIQDRFEAALNEAKAYDEKLKSGEVNVSMLEKEKPLYGVPITVKESCSLKDMSYTGCSLSRRGMKTFTDSPAVESLKTAGAIPLCVTNTPEYCCSFHSSNLLFGSTVNPYDTRQTAGGSSGGEAALIGAGASLIGVGSDLIGSIRIPAHFTGIFGHKPTPGIIPIKGHFPISENVDFQKLLVIGPLARYAEDLHLAVKLMSSKCGRDLHLDQPVDVKTLRVFHADNNNSFLDVRGTSLEIKNRIKDACDYLAETGATVKPIPGGWLDNILNMQMSNIFHVEQLPQLLIDPKNPKRKKNPLYEMVKAIFGLSEHTKSAIYMQLLMDTHGFIPSSKVPYYQNWARQLREKMTELLKTDGVFIYPTFPTSAVFPSLTPLRPDCCIYCGIVNVLHLPSTHVTMGLNKDGLPIGFQVIAGPYQDRLCLAVAKELEKAFGGWIPPSG